MSSTLDRVLHPTALADLAERFAEYTRDPRADSTQRVYATAWRQFGEWCQTQGAASAPLLLDALLRVVEPLGDRLVDHRDRAILVLGFFGAYRRAELVALALADVERLRDPAHGAYLRTLIRRSKRDRAGKGIVRGLWQQDDPRVCPVEAFDTWTRVAGLSEGPLFRRIDRLGRLGVHALAPAAVAAIVKQRAAAVGLDPVAIAGHSLRRGLATTADREGRSLSEIADHLAHADIRTTRGYVTHPSVVRNNLTRGMARRAG